jgi:rRNA processing protein Krr1/Pno1
MGIEFGDFSRFRGRVQHARGIAGDTEDVKEAEDMVEECCMGKNHMNCRAPEGTKLVSFTTASESSIYYLISMKP